ncbi:Protein of unknown function [Gryllus bimaculatus]|nr:Protein of unknown function [Gryllus bimaculatus]
MPGPALSAAVDATTPHRRRACHPAATPTALLMDKGKPRRSLPPTAPRQTPGRWAAVPKGKADTARQPMMN